MTNIPVLMVRGNGIAEAWENSLIELHKNGLKIPTQYDKPGDPPSIDASMTIVIENPFAEPMIHKDFPGGLEDLQEYVLEVTQGIKDHCVRDPNDPSDKRWEYTYHQRLFDYNIPKTVTGAVFKYDQIETMARKIAETPHTRRAQAVTWKVWEDNDCYDPACLQSIWTRCIPDESGVWYLNANIRFRSNDAYKAAFMNMFAITMLLNNVAKRVSELSGKEVRLGRYVHSADSYHIYGSYMKEFEGRFINALKVRTFEERTMNYEDVKEMMDSAIPGILLKAKGM